MKSFAVPICIGTYLLTVRVTYTMIDYIPSYMFKVLPVSLDQIKDLFEFYFFNTSPFSVFVTVLTGNINARY